MVNKTIEDARTRVNPPYVLPDRTKTALSEAIRLCQGRLIMFYREITDDGLSIEVFPAEHGDHHLLWLVRGPDIHTGEDTVLADGAV